MRPNSTIPNPSPQTDKEGWRSSLVLLAISGIVLFLAFLLRSPYMAFGLYAFLILVVSAYVSSSFFLKGLHCERSINRLQLWQGEELEVSILITNKQRWPIPWLFMEDDYPSDFPRQGLNKRLSILMPGKSVSLRYKLTCPRRGYHRIGPILYESGDFFGLHKRFRSGETRDYVSVLPTIAYIETFNVAARRPQGPVRITNRIYTDPTRISTIREYVPGDPLNSIHWKATARTDRLQVKCFDPSSVSGGTLILDLHEDSYVPEKREARMELAITTTASIAYLLQLSGEQVGLLTNGRDAAEIAQYETESWSSSNRFQMDALLEQEAQYTRVNPLTVLTARGIDQAQKIIENLARVVPGQHLQLADLIVNGSRNLPRDATLLPVTGQITDRVALTLALMKQYGFNVTVFLIDAGTHYNDASKLLAEHNIPMFHIETERHLHEISPQRI
ncbi:MAG: DUF58 domain-containing protein [Candidatus Hydrogenedentes bacterium]|jgi:hypothetical protein|nr:DUF58 domain-containing protein [Candidatus Hydrogenedentota bacterium]